ncbi:MAG: uncharacterized protein JWO98_4765 [Frankiales bacterium]|nr:uncharacterized protein [Frankiales bacterium]
MDATRRPGSRDKPRYEIRLSEPGEIAAALLHLLGFRPRESVVLVGLGGASGARVGLTVRADIPPAGREALLGPVLVSALAAGVGAEPPSAVLVAIVSEAGTGPAEDDLPHRELLHQLVLAIADRAIPVRDALLVRRGRWWSYDCPHPCCAPGAGTPLPSGVSELEVASVAEGQVVAGDRAELPARIAPVGDPLGAMAAAIRRVGRECSARVRERGWDTVVAESWAAVAGAVAALRPGTTARLEDAQVARVVWGLRDATVRDRALGLALGVDAAAAESLWTACTRRAPAPLDAAPATLLAVSAWLRGDGAMAGIALARARDSDPAYGLAVQLERALAACFPPAELRALIVDGLLPGVDGRPDR